LPGRDSLYLAGENDKEIYDRRGVSVRASSPFLFPINKKNNLNRKRDIPFRMNQIKGLTKYSNFLKLHKCYLRMDFHYLE